MKRIISTLCFLTPILLFGQATEANLLGFWEDESITPTSWLDSRYNDVWGAEINGVEYAIVGSTEGMHFLSLADPTAPEEVAFVQGAATGPSLVHRDVKIYQHYAIAVADEGSSTLQIIDMSDLPNSVNVVYDSNEFVRTAHNVFVDEPNSRLYAISGNSPNGSFRVRILSLDNPADPQQLGTFPSGGIIPSTHDIYVKDHIGYINCGSNGFYVVDFTDPNNAILLGTMTDYPQAGYNHAGWLSEDGNYYFLCDETHGTDVKVVDVSDFSDMNVVALMNAESTANQISHNAYVQGNLLYVSYYYDGLQVFDISNPLAPVRVKYYDTFDGENDNFFQGAWGVFVMPSGKTLLSDMNNGFYVFDNIVVPPNHNIIPSETDLLACFGEELIFSITIGNGFENPVDLTMTGIPFPGLANFSENPAAPGSTVNVVVTGLTNEGDIEAVITGTDDITTTEAEIGIYANFAPDFAELYEPADQSVNIAVQPTFSWSAGTNVGTYLIEVSTSADEFLTHLIFKETVTENYFDAPAELEHLTQYYWRVTTKNPCGYNITEIISFETQELVNVTEVAGSQFQVFPNPVRNDLNIQFENALNQAIQMDLFNATGQIMLSQNVGSGTNHFSVNVSHLPKGIYFLKMADGENSVMEKVIVE